MPGLEVLSHLQAKAARVKTLQETLGHPVQRRCSACLSCAWRWGGRRRPPRACWLPPELCSTSGATRRASDANCPG